jgi:hypothetical protein
VPIFFPQLLFLLPLLFLKLDLLFIFFPTLVVVTMVVVTMVVVTMVLSALVLSAMQLSRNASKHLLRCDQGEHQAKEQQEGGTEGLHG